MSAFDDIKTNTEIILQQYKDLCDLKEERIKNFKEHIDCLERKVIALEEVIKIYENAMKTYVERKD